MLMKDSQIYGWQHFILLWQHADMDRQEQVHLLMQDLLNEIQVHPLMQDLLNELQVHSLMQDLLNEID